MTRHVVMFSAGIGSWAAAKRVVAQHGPDALTLLFTDTLVEDEDAYRFLIEGAANVFGIALPTQFVPPLDQFPSREDPVARALFLRGLAIEAMALIPGLFWIAEGRTPFQVFRNERFLGNSRVDPCSKVLKRQVAAAWLDANCDPAATTVYVGIDWTEAHRLDDGKGGGVAPRRAAEGWVYEGPMCAAPYMLKNDMIAWVRREGLAPPRLYGLGWPHNNCGGWCCRMGQGQGAMLLRELPDVYAWAEREEAEIIAMLGRDVSMLTDRSGDGAKKPLTLRALRERIQAGGQIDMFDLGACGCFMTEVEAKYDTAS